MRGVFSSLVQERDADRLRDGADVETALARHESACILVVTGNGDGDHGSSQPQLETLNAVMGIRSRRPRPLTPFTGEILMMTDYQLCEEVKHEISAALHNAIQNKASRISIEASDGIVVLGGFVKTNDERDKAEHVARRNQGVRAVYNDIRVAA